MDSFEDKGIALMDLKNFYFQNIKKSEYHYRFLDSVKKVNYAYNIFSGEEETQDYQFEIYDVEEAVAKFKELCQPDVNFSVENKCWFYLITYYLHTLGYEIREFPRILARPPVEPTDFTYGVLEIELSLWAEITMEPSDTQPEEHLLQS